ncbi:MAG: hypothetical protein LWW97_08675 [Deltaproteobacteria bacterium]|nr:hypothetical protein [Deltaproteobacteria bacterium]
MLDLSRGVALRLANSPGRYQPLIYDVKQVVETVGTDFHDLAFGCHFAIVRKPDFYYISQSLIHQVSVSESNIT